ncbi:MAG: hypothetical protein E1N59_2803 [Puniceicoccaceae bacterium 5H]|nr:MAG: hypothetical protein E1N59_2803 [Puniceicoccaceae bacterium 5H]
MQGAHYLGRARICGRLYHLPGAGYPAASDEKGWIWGDCWQIEEADQWRTLDYWEDLRSRDHEGVNLYYRRPVPLHPASGSDLGRAWVYRMRIERIRQMKGIRLTAGVWPPRLPYAWSLLA